MAKEKEAKKPSKKKAESEESEPEETKDSESESEASESESKKTSESESESESEESEESEKASESESESEEVSKDKLVQIQEYEPRAPTNPIPVGYEDCFGKYYDPDAPECQNKRCLERDNCKETMKARQSENEKGKTKKMAKKTKKVESESESEKETKKTSKSKKASESESESEKSTKKSKKASESESESEKPSKKKTSKKDSESENPAKKKSKSKGMSDAVKTLLEKSGFEKAGGEIKAKEGEDGVYQGFIDDKRALRITGAGKDEGFKVRAFFPASDKPRTWGLEKGDWKYAGDATYWNYVGDDMKSLATQLKEYFKLKVAASKGGSD